jgi:hypothetical protein
MKNIHNLISDAFVSINNHRIIETDYTIGVVYRENLIRDYEITIKSKDPELVGKSAFLHLRLNRHNTLEDYNDTNTLFIENQWDLFCISFENYFQPVAVSNDLLNQIAALIDGSHGEQEEGEQNEFYEPTQEEELSSEED